MDSDNGSEFINANLLRYCQQHQITFTVNFCQPVMKLISRERVGSKIKKRYDRARTPYQRVLESDEVSEEVKQRLREQYVCLNPVTLLRQIESPQEALWRRMKARFTSEVTIPSG